MIPRGFKNTGKNTKIGTKNQSVQSLLLIIIIIIIIIIINTLQCGFNPLRIFVEVLTPIRPTAGARVSCPA